jgi:uncharacterized damage-inducible protein DinB
MPFSETLLPEFEEELKNTRKILERVPDARLDFQPHPKSMTLGGLATHVANLPSWATITIGQDVLDMEPGFKMPVAESRAQLLELFDKGVAEAKEKLAGATDETWAQTWTLKMAGHTILALPRSTVMRSYVMNHLIHHRAQLGDYLRLLDVEIPGMYGPSADESTF